jgi:uncharacterized protein involved in exopolysaccharide biosynthesis
MSLADHLRVVAANWWRILLVALAVGAAIYFYSNSLDRVYESSTLLSVAPGLGSPDTNNLTSDELGFRAEYYANIASQSRIAVPAAEEAKLNISRGEATSRIGTLASETSGFILLTAKDRRRPTREHSRREPRKRSPTTSMTSRRRCPRRASSRCRAACRRYRTRSTGRRPIPHSRTASSNRSR